MAQPSGDARPSNRPAETTIAAPPYTAQRLRQATRNLLTLLEAVPIELLDDETDGTERESLRFMYEEHLKAITVLGLTARAIGLQVCVVGDGDDARIAMVPPIGSVAMGSGNEPVH